MGCNSDCTLEKRASARERSGINFDFARLWNDLIDEVKGATTY